MPPLPELQEGVGGRWGQELLLSLESPPLHSLPLLLTWEGGVLRTQTTTGLMSCR